MIKETCYCDICGKVFEGEEFDKSVRSITFYTHRRGGGSPCLNDICFNCGNEILEKAVELGFKYEAR